MFSILSRLCPTREQKPMTTLFFRFLCYSQKGDGVFKSADYLYKLCRQTMFNLGMNAGLPHDPREFLGHMLSQFLTENINDREIIESFSLSISNNTQCTACQKISKSVNVFRVPFVWWTINTDCIDTTVASACGMIEARKGFLDGTFTIPLVHPLSSFCSECNATTPCIVPRQQTPTFIGDSPTFMFIFVHTSPSNLLLRVTSKEQIFGCKYEVLASINGSVGHFTTAFYDNDTLYTMNDNVVTQSPHDSTFEFYPDAGPGVLFLVKKCDNVGSTQNNLIPSSCKVVQNLKISVFSKQCSSTTLYSSTLNWENEDKCIATGETNEGKQEKVQVTNGEVDGTSEDDTERLTKGGKKRRSSSNGRDNKDQELEDQELENAQTEEEDENHKKHEVNDDVMNNKECKKRKLMENEGGTVKTKNKRKVTETVEEDGEEVTVGPINKKKKNI